MSKFIDLEPQVSDYYGTTPGQERRAGICDALRYLDSHPERVPGRTITDSEYEDAIEGKSWDYGIGYFEAISNLGVTITPDPEPTNAEKLNDLLMEFTHLNAPCGGEVYDHDFGEFLTARGVKAPEADDE